MGRLKRLASKKFRDAYVRANIEHGIAHQIRIQRKAKGWSQSRLASKIGVHGQSAIARLEDPSYGRYNLTTLIKLASAFDVALIVKFLPFSRFVAETSDLSPTALFAEGFVSEYPKLLQRAQFVSSAGAAGAPIVVRNLNPSPLTSVIDFQDPVRIPASREGASISEMNFPSTGAHQCLQ